MASVPDDWATVKNSAHRSFSSPCTAYEVLGAGRLAASPIIPILFRGLDLFLDNRRECAASTFLAFWKYSSVNIRRARSGFA